MRLRTADIYGGMIPSRLREDETLPALAQSIAAQDDLVDADFSAAKQALIDAIAKHPEQGETALDLLMIAKYFERIGDHAVNLSEWVEFSVTGIHKHDGEQFD